MFRHLLQGRGHEMVNLLIHSRIVVFLYEKMQFFTGISSLENTQYRTIVCSLINMQSCQLQENEMLRRMSLIGSVLMPTLVSALNRTIIFLFYI